jgi:hypothetical protein
MPDLEKESAQVEGSGENANSSASQNSGGQPTSHSGAGQLPEQLDSLVEAAVAKALQNPKVVQSLKDKTLSDKRFAQVAKAVNDFQPVLQRFKGLVSDEQLAQIQRDLEFDDLKRRVYGDESNSEDSETGNQRVAAASDFTRVIDEVLQLPENDSRVTDLKLKHRDNPKEYLSEGLKLLARLGTQEESTPGEQPIPRGGAVQKDDNPIKDIDDPKALYRLAAQKIAQEAKGRRVRG